MASNFLPRDIVQARRMFREGEPLPPGLLPPPLLRSWERTAATGIRPADRLLFGQSVSSADARHVEEEYRTLINLASPDIVNLWDSMQSPNWVVLFTNAEGTILHSFGEYERAPRELRLPLRCGRRLPESEMGTNAPAVVLSELEACVIQGGEHFLDELSRFSCAAAPVFNLEGTLAGILDVTGFDVALEPRALQRVNLTARSIENRLFEATTTGVLLSLHEDSRFFGTPLQGLILVREDGRILTANRAAKQMLHIDQNFIQRGQNIQFEQILDQHLYTVLSSGDRVSPLAVRTTRGSRLYIGLLRRPLFPTINGIPSTENVKEQLSSDSRINSQMDRAELVFRRRIPVLLQGETGTGKEWFARHLHERVRPGKPFVAINCSAIAESLAESELFGYEEGAYTGSRKGGSPGKIEQAQGGTLFLDEIGDMPLPLQTRLLRTLQERSNVRLGGQKEIKLDILVVSATHRDLELMIKDVTFREDLYFRLNGFSVQLPALRERQDLDELISQLLYEYTEQGESILLPQPLRQSLLAYAWPGNIRQLRHVIEVACALADANGVIESEALPDDMTAGQFTAPAVIALPEPLSQDSSLLNLKEEWVNSALDAHSGNVSAAAKALGVSRTTLYKYLRR